MNATLYVLKKTGDAKITITSLEDLRAALPDVPENPSLFRLGVADTSVHVCYGSPDRHHAETKVFTANGIERQSFDTFDAATESFLSIVAALT